MTNTSSDFILSRKSQAITIKDIDRLRKRLKVGQKVTVYKTVKEGDREKRVKVQWTITVLYQVFMQLEREVNGTRIQRGLNYVDYMMWVG